MNYSMKPIQPREVFTLKRGMYLDVQLFDCSIRTKLNKHSKQKQPSKNETKSMIVISSWKAWKRADENEK